MIWTVNNWSCKKNLKPHCPAPLCCPNYIIYIINILLYIINMLPIFCLGQPYQILGQFYLTKKLERISGCLNY